MNPIFRELNPVENLLCELQFLCVYCVSVIVQAVPVYTGCQKDLIWILKQRCKEVVLKSKKMPKSLPSLKGLQAKKSKLTYCFIIIWKF